MIVTRGGVSQIEISNHHIEAVNHRPGLRRGSYMRRVIGLVPFLEAATKLHWRLLLGLSDPIPLIIAIG